MTEGQSTDESRAEVMVGLVRLGKLQEADAAAPVLPFLLRGGGMAFVLMVQRLVAGRWQPAGGGTETPGSQGRGQLHEVPVGRPPTWTAMRR
jgi:hypothetical protein